MRITNILAIIRILLLMVIPSAALAANSQAVQNKNQGTLMQIEKGKIKNLTYKENYQNTKSIFDQVIKASKNPPVKKKAEKKNYSNLIVTRNQNVKILVTGYSSTPDQCWGDPFTTASGAKVRKGTMACPPQYPFGAKIKIKGMGEYVCEDRGGAIKGNHFDMWFESRAQALAWGKRTVEAEIKF